MDFELDGSWRRVLAPEFEREYFVRLMEFVRGEYRRTVVYPSAPLVFAALNRTPLERVKAVIIGQDPYHRPGQAQGLAFSVPPTEAKPPSLVNIHKELQAEFGGDFVSRSGDLSDWADQGVLLLNATLTVVGGDSAMAGSHQRRGWEEFTDAVVRTLAERREHLVYLLWGAYAQRKAAFVDRTRNLVLECAHPSPLSARRGFFGCGHFRQANEYLVAHGLKPIAW